MQHLYAVTAENLKRAREKEYTETETNLQNDLKIGDLVLVRNVNLDVFEPKYSPNYRIIAIYGNNNIAVKAPDGKVQVRHRGHIKKIDPVDKVISLVPSAEDYQKFGRNTKLLIHPDNIPDTNISLSSRKQVKMTSEESKIGENYQDSREKLKMSSIKIPEDNKKQTKMTSEESEIGENYQDLREKSRVSNIETLNSIDCSVEMLNEVNISLISASCPVKEQPTKDEHIKFKLPEELVWNRLKSFLSSKPVVKANENSGFSLFL